MQEFRREINVNGLSYLCGVTHTDNIEHWRCANADAVAWSLKKNGAEVISVSHKLVEVDRNVYYFMNTGERFTLNQCEDLLEWVRTSKEGEFTYYYDKVVFHRNKQFVAAYRDDIDNYWTI